MPADVSNKTVLVTGASSGIGQATAIAFARLGYRVGIGARRVDRLEALLPRLSEAGADETFQSALDVCDRDSVRNYVAAFREALGTPNILVNNAGLARGTETIRDAKGLAWREMMETNVFGVLHMTHELLEPMIQAGGGTIIMVGSVAGRQAYAGGSVYCASKRALQSICASLRIETLGLGIRVSCVDPGLADTEFGVVRFSGDQAKADKVYEGIQSLSGEDVAECILFAATRPPHVNIDDILVMPTIQADPWHIHRD
jgi:3-hydroxy acid dehydrogenase / malonic semialdehyde reductase